MAGSRGGCWCSAVSVVRRSAPAGTTGAYVPSEKHKPMPSPRPRGKRSEREGQQLEAAEGRQGEDMKTQSQCKPAQQHHVCSSRFRNVAHLALRHYTEHAPAMSSAHRIRNSSTAPSLRPNEAWLLHPTIRNSVVTNRHQAKEEARTRTVPSAYNGRQACRHRFTMKARHRCATCCHHACYIRTFIQPIRRRQNSLHDAAAMRVRLTSASILELRLPGCSAECYQCFDHAGRVTPTFYANNYASPPVKPRKYFMNTEKNTEKISPVQWYPSKLVRDRNFPPLSSASVCVCAMTESQAGKSKGIARQMRGSQWDTGRG
jgi:hypothetical protein